MNPPRVCTSPTAEALLGDHICLGLMAHVLAVGSKSRRSNDNLVSWPPFGGKRG